MKIEPCKCGCSDLIIWKPRQSQAGPENMLEMEKIECPECGNIVYGSDDEAIEDWNSHEYD